MRSVELLVGDAWKFNHAHVSHFIQIPWITLIHAGASTLRVKLVTGECQVMKQSTNAGITIKIAHKGILQFTFRTADIFTSVPSWLCLDSDLRFIGHSEGAIRSNGDYVKD